MSACTGADGVVVSHLFSAVYIGMTALSVAAAVFLGTIVMRAEMKTAPTTTPTMTMKEMCQGGLHSAVRSSSNGGQGLGK